MTMFSMAGTTPDRTLSLIYANGDTATVPESHDRFDDLLALVLSGADDTEVMALVDIMFAASSQLAQLSERISIRGRTVLFDGDALRGEIGDVLVELFESGDPETLRPVVNFLEKAATNPSGRSVDDLYRWITKGDLIIHEDGDFLAYKGTRTDRQGLRTSISQGSAFVNGEEHTGYIPNPDGAVVTMPRSNVDDNSAEGCSTGLHAGTAAYAFDFANHETILVKINPRDVVSVPEESSSQKLRVCRYIVQGPVDSRQESRVFYEFEPLVVVEGYEETLPTATTTAQTATNTAVSATATSASANATSAAVSAVFDVAPQAAFVDDWASPIREDYNEDEMVAIYPEGGGVLLVPASLLRETDEEGEQVGPTEAEVELAAAHDEGSDDAAVIRDSHGRFTPESAIKAVRNSKGQFTKKS